MKTELKAANLEEFRKRFGRLHDAVIHYVTYEMYLRKAVEICVGTKDSTAPNSNPWVNLTLDVEEVRQVILKKPVNYSVSVIFEVNIDFFESEVYLDFFPQSGQSDSPLDYEDAPGRKGPHLVVVGKRCFWSTAPYQEQGLILRMAGQP